MQTELERKLTRLYAPVIEHKGLRLVCVRVHGGNGSCTVQVMAEDPATRKLNVDDCARISRELSALMDVEDPIKGAYRLEVSSPGLDRLLVSLQDFTDFCGFEAKIEIDPPLEGRKRFRGRLKATDVEKESVLLETDEGPVTLPYGAVQKAKLILTDDLIKAKR